MNKKENSKNERIRGVRVKQVWLKEDLLSSSPDSISVHPGLKKVLTTENEDMNSEDRNYIRSLKHLILSSTDLFVVFVDTEMETEGGFQFGGRAFLTDRKNFLDITGIMVITNLAGCRFKEIHPPFEDFINDFIIETYF